MLVRCMFPHLEFNFKPFGKIVLAANKNLVSVLAIPLRRRGWAWAKVESLACGFLALAMCPTVGRMGQCNPNAPFLSISERGLLPLLKLCFKGTIWQFDDFEHPGCKQHEPGIHTVDDARLQGRWGILAH